MRLLYIHILVGYKETVTTVKDNPYKPSL